MMAWGVLTALFAPRRLYSQLATAGIGIGLMGLGIGLFAPHWWPILLVAVAVVPLGVNGVRNGLIALLRRPRVVGAAAAVLAVTGVAFEVWWYDRSIDAEMDAAFEMAVGEMPPDTKEAAIQVKTDRGTVVTLFDPVDPRSLAEANERDRNAPAVNNYLGRWIRRGSADDQTNCHGWVFAAGRYNLSGRYVNTILSENEYIQVSEPRPGDVCVYRDQRGEVLHSGLVRGVLNDCTVMVEGKWGRLGVYLHDASDSCYGTNFLYYRSERDGHTLAGLDHTTRPKLTTPIGVGVVAPVP